MHIVISVKDFKAIVTHAETLRGSLSAHFSRPSRPLQFAYQASGMHCEYTLMTTGDYRGASTSSTPKTVTNRSISQPASNVPTQTIDARLSEMPPPARPTSTASHVQRKSLSSLNKGVSLTAPSQNSDSLFVPNDEADDRRWGEPDYETEEAEDMLGWDASGEIVCRLCGSIRSAC